MGYLLTVIRHLPLIGGIVAFEALAADPVPLPQLCATDLDYKVFERIQQSAYINAGDKFALLEDSPEQMLAFARESNEKATGVGKVPPVELDRILARITSIKLPTCYEHRALFSMIQGYANDAQIAAARFLFAGPALPTLKFGSLPYAEINAYTFQTGPGDRGVIAIDVQLFTFIYEFTSAVAIGRGLARTEGPSAAYFDNGASQHFLNVVSSFLDESRIPGRADLQGQGRVIVSILAGTMARFVFNHEVGHIALGHLSAPTSLSIGSVPGSYPILTHTWEQELQADALSFDLILQLLADHMTEPLSGFSDSWASGIAAPELFMEYLSILREARYIKLNHKLPPPVDEPARRVARDCVVESSRCAELHNDPYPPPWLRQEYLDTKLRATLDSLRRSPSPLATINQAESSRWVEAARSLWRRTAPLYLSQVSAQRTLPASGR